MQLCLLKLFQHIFVPDSRHAEAIASRETSLYFFIPGALQQTMPLLVNLHAKGSRQFDVLLFHF